MEKASKVMYSIANIFNWILLLTGITGIVLFSLMFTGVIPNTSEYEGAALIGAIIAVSVITFFALITILMVRRAKADNSSKGWDFLFIILGVLSSNIFYILGGIFGLVAPRK